MLQIYSSSENGVEVLENSNIVFNNEAIQTGSSVTANIPTSVISLNRPGIYSVEFDAVVASNTAPPAAQANGVDAYALPAPEGVSGVVMTRNNVEVEQAFSGESSATSEDVVAIGFKTLVRVFQSCRCIDNSTTIAFKVVGQNTLVYHANVVVTKIS